MRWRTLCPERDKTVTVQGSPASHWSPEHDVLSFGFNSAKEFAQKSQTTMGALMEEGLHRFLADSQAQAKPAPFGDRVVMARAGGGGLSALAMAGQRDHSTGAGK